MFKELQDIRTEQRNPRSARVDEMSVSEVLELINEEDARVAGAVRDEIPQIERAVNLVVKAFRSGGRLIYVGAGTSGRLGIVDASECPPTFGSPPGMVQGVIAGGEQAVFRAQEGAEDKREGGAAAMEAIKLEERDVVCGIAASGRTPYVLGALSEAKRRGCATVLITTSSAEHVRRAGAAADVIIAPNVGPEVVAGSTRMKSGTAQKLTLNMITTAAMVALGKTYGNVMVDLQLTNEKLRERARRIVMEIAGLDYDAASKALDAAGGHVKTALVMTLAGMSREEAREALDCAEGKIKRAIGR